jgi:hypothetical protein
MVFPPLSLSPSQLGSKFCIDSEEFCQEFNTAAEKLPELSEINAGADDFSPAG